MDEAFEVHMLTGEGKAKAMQMAGAFDTLMTQLRELAPPGREMSIVATKLEEACFFAKKALAKVNSEASQTQAPG